MRRNKGIVTVKNHEVIDAFEVPVFFDGKKMQHPFVHGSPDVIFVIAFQIILVGKLRKSFKVDVFDTQKVSDLVKKGLRLHPKVR